MIGMKVNVDLLWKEIDLMTMYNVSHGKLADALSFYGVGVITYVHLFISFDSSSTDKPVRTRLTNGFDYLEPERRPEK